MKKGELFQDIEITDLSAKGKGVARIKKAVAFVENAIPGDLVDLQIIKQRKGYFDAKLVKMHQESDKRQKAVCSHFGICGGCRIQNMKYKNQLKFKEQQVLNNLTRIGGLESPEILPILGSETTEYYRNKLEFSFSTSRWLSQEEIASGKQIENRQAVGFHVAGRYDKLVDIEHCYLQDKPSNDVRNFIRQYARNNKLSFFNPYHMKGMLRALFIRTSTSNEVMINMVFGENINDQAIDLLAALKTEFPEISSIYYLVNTKKNDSIYDLKPVLFSGNAYITEHMEHIQIKLGPKSFYQTNSIQALELYKTVRQFGELNPDEIVYDLYSGVGSIGLYLAKDVKKIIGIETVEEAVHDAEENRRINNINNITFYSGQVEKLLSMDFANENGDPDILIIDPPRPGVHKTVIQSILEIKPKKIIYISCNPATQARDIELLTSSYQFIKSQPVDMFPHTLHIENVSLLELK